MKVHGLHMYKAKLDGEDYAAERSTIAAAAGIRRLDDRTNVRIRGQGGYSHKLSVSGDGKTLTTNIQDVTTQPLRISSAE